MMVGEALVKVVRLNSCSELKLKVTEAINEAEVKKSTSRTCGTYSAQN